MSEWRAVRYGMQHKIGPDGRARCGRVCADSTAWVQPDGHPFCRLCVRWTEPVHGTVRGYVTGCRCQPCTSANSTATRERKWAAREARGSGVAVDVSRHGRAAYVNHLCRCQVCATDHRLGMREARNARKAARILGPDGRLIATTTDRHGSASTYENHGCRCMPCTDAATANKRAYVQAKRQAS